jgi:hypothetical protein
MKKSMTVHSKRPLSKHLNLDEM